MRLCDMLIAIEKCTRLFIFSAALLQICNILVVLRIYVILTTQGCDKTIPLGMGATESTGFAYLLRLFY